MRIKIKEKAGNVGIAVAKEAPKKPRKNSTKPSAAAKPIAIDSETVEEVTRPKSKGRQNKSTAKPISVESDEDEDLVALKNRLASYNLDSSPETSATETDTVPETASAAKEGPKKRAEAARKAFKVVSDEDTDDDEDIENCKAPRGKKGGGRGKKPANATTKAKATTEKMKREAPNKPVLSQRLTPELLPAPTNAISSPEKKVRKIRPSSFNKKSGSFLNRSGINNGEDSSSSGASHEEQREDIVARARPKRENRSRAMYVESESEEDEVLSEYSNFEEEDDD